MKRLTWTSVALLVMIGTVTAQQKSISKRTEPVFLNVGEDLKGDEIVLTWLDPADPNIKTRDLKIKVRLDVRVGGMKPPKNSST